MPHEQRAVASEQQKFKPKSFGSDNSDIQIVHLTNRTGPRVGYNLCRSRVEQQNNEGDWAPVQGEAEVCTAELVSNSFRHTRDE